MNRRSVLLLGCAVSAVLVAGCGSPWQVIRQASPDPFLGQKKFAVHPVTYEGLLVGGKTEAEYLAEKEEETRSNWSGDRAGINEHFMTNLTSRALEAGIQVVPATGPDAAPFFIRANVSFIEPGFYVGVAAGASKVRMTVLITAPDGSVLDEIILEHRTGGSLVNAATGTRLREDGENIGKNLAEYLKTRVAPEA